MELKESFIYKEKSLVDSASLEVVFKILKGKKELAFGNNNSFEMGNKKYFISDLVKCSIKKGKTPYKIELIEKLNSNYEIFYKVPNGTYYFKEIRDKSDIQYEGLKDTKKRAFCNFINENFDNFNNESNKPCKIRGYFIRKNINDRGFIKLSYVKEIKNEEY